MLYELIIIGAGPAGITAAVYAARKRLNFLVITQDIGGQTILSADIENYTGYQFVTGPELVAKFEEHMRQFSVPLKENEAVLKITRDKDAITIKTDKDTYQSRTVIIASGRRARKLEVPGEDKLMNKGVSYCSTCDGPLFRDRDVAVIGGGNSALDAALQMIKIAKTVTVVNVNPKMAGDPIMLEKFQEAGNAKILNNSRTKEILGDKFVEGLKLIRDNKEETLNVQGVFVEIGSTPNSDFIDIVEKNKWNEVVVNTHTETSVEAIYAAGDVTDVPEKQIIVAAGEGSKAALAASRYLAVKR